VIVHVTDCFHPRLGGIEVQVAELAEVQRANGETVHVVTATPPPPDERVGRYGYPVHRLVAPMPWELPIHPRAGRHLDRLFGDLRPDVVHVHVGAVAPFAWSAVRCALRAGLPTVVTAHSYWDPATRGMYRVFDQLTGWSRTPLVCTAVSTAVAGLIRRVAPDITPTVVPNGIAMDEWRIPPREPGDRVAGDVHIAAVGRLAPRKRPMTLLKVLRATRSRVDDRVKLCATIAGDGPALSRMQRYLHRHAMTDWVHLSGRMDRVGVRAMLASADLFINPTERESFGVATLEARTVGLPVVARAGNGVADFIAHGREGLLCRDTDALVEGLTWLAQDDQARHRISAHNRAVQPVACTWPTVTSALSRCYDQAVSQCAPTP
jgi:glycosyltransferase involved in cell wall biosynthesis